MTKENMQKAIGEVIKRSREGKKLTQLEAATEAGISRNYLSDVENGRYMPSVETLLTLVKNLDIDLSLLSRMTEIQV